MVISCDRCVIRAAACADCVITVLEPRDAAGVPGGMLAGLDAAELSALRVLAEAGMVSPLGLSSQGGRVLPGARTWTQRVVPDSKAS
jgi:hypothetical protein